METNYQEKQKLPKKNNNTIIYIFSLLLIIGLIVIVLLSKESPYEKGTEYLRQKQFSEALSEFQKVDAQDKDFRLAQSKINYINGLRAFNDSLMEEAAVYLTKVDNDDEYRHDAQLMLDKIRDLENRAFKDEMKQKDTVIVKHEIAEKTQKTQTPPTDYEINKKYVSRIDGLINKFESQYQSARSAPVSSKKDYAANMSSIMSQLIGTSYAPKQIDANVIELKRLINLWMDKRIAFIEKLVAENSVSETNNSRSLKEEGDKLYYAVINQMKKVKSTYS
jgi:hypothetical protein